MSKLIFSKTLVFIAVILNCSIWSQTIQNDYCFGGSGSDILQGVVNLSDGNKLLIGTSDSPISGTKTENGFGGIDGYLVMLNNQNQEIWQKTIGGTSDDALYSGIELSDGNLLIAGTTYSGVSGNKTSGNYGGQDLWLLKISPAGVVLFDKVYGGTSTELFGGLINQISNSTIIIPASSHSGVSGNKTTTNLGGTDAWYLKIDLNGNLLSDYVFGGTSLDDGVGIEKLSPNRYLLFNYTSSNDGNITGPVYGNGDIWLVKTDSSFNIIDQKLFGADDSEGISCFKMKGPDKLVIVSTTTSGISGLKTEANYGNFDAWVLEIDTSLNLLNQKSIGSNADDGIGTFDILQDGGIVLKMSSSSNVNAIKTHPFIGWNDLWVVKLDANLNKIYDNVYGTNLNDYFCGLVTGTNSSNYFFGGSYGGVNNDKTCVGYGQSDFWVVQTDNFLGEVEHEITSELNVHPNPATDHVDFNLMNPSIQEETVFIYSQEGKLIETLKFDSGSTKLTWYPQVVSGIYFYQIGEQTGKIVLNR